jgi:hypothetical protein
MIRNSHGDTGYEVRPSFSIHFPQQCTFRCSGDYSVSSDSILSITQWRLFLKQCHATGTNYAAESRHWTQRCHSILSKRGSARAISCLSTSENATPACLVTMASISVTGRCLQFRHVILQGVVRRKHRFLIR